MNNKRIDIYVGLGNQDIKKEDFVERLSLYCEKNKIDFSLLEQDGGYVLDNGGYVIEKSIRITLIGNYRKESIIDFVNVVKKDYNQESILIDVQEIGVQYN